MHYKSSDSNKISVASNRLAAFRLGYHGRLLESILNSGTEADFRIDHDVHGCIEKIEEAVIILEDNLSTSEALRLDSLLNKLGELHDIVSEIGPFEEAEDERRAIEKLEQPLLERFEFLSGKLVHKDTMLEAWYEVGIALAELRHRVTYVYETAPIPEADWNRLNHAVDRLPLEDRSKAGPLAGCMIYRNLGDLAAEIREVYSDLCQILSTDDRQLDRETESAPAVQERVSSAPLPIDRDSSSPQLISESTGLAHSNSFSICRAKGVIYNLRPAAGALVHAMHEWRKQGVQFVSKDDIFDKAVYLYLNDQPMTKVVESLYDRQINKVFKDSGLWMTLVKPSSDRKGLYTLDL